jgi:hypothetical protein
MPDVDRFDRTGCGDREQSSGGVTENYMACAVLPVLHGEFVRNHFQILDPPIPWVHPHSPKDFGGVRHKLMVSLAVPQCKLADARPDEAEVMDFSTLTR